MESRIWHDKLMCRGAAVDHRIHESEYINSLIDTISRYTDSNGYVNVESLNNRGVHIPIRLLRSVKLDSNIDAGHLIRTLLTGTLDDDIQKENLSSLPKPMAVDAAIKEMNQNAGNQKLSTRKQSNKKMVSVDVVASLFTMSNELKQERELIVNNGGLISNCREYVSKYNDELDDVIHAKQSAILHAKKATSIRLKKTVPTQKILGDPKDDNFWTFWSTLQSYQVSGSNSFLKPNSHDRKSNLPLNPPRNQIRSLQPPPDIAMFRQQLMNKSAQLETKIVNNASDEIAPVRSPSYRSLEHVLEEGVGFYLKLKSTSMNDSDTSKSLVTLSQKLLSPSHSLQNTLQSTLKTLPECNSDEQQLKFSMKINENSQRLFVPESEFEGNEILQSPDVLFSKENCKSKDNIIDSKPDALSYDNFDQTAAKSVHILSVVSRFGSEKLLTKDIKLSDSIVSDSYSHEMKSKVAVVMTMADSTLGTKNNQISSRDQHFPAPAITRQSFKSVYVPYPISSKRLACDEISFNPQTLCLSMSFARDNEIFELFKLNISNLFVLANSNGTVVLRSPQVSGGYVCTLPSHQWAMIRHELISSIAMTIKIKPTQLRDSSDPSYSIRQTEIACPQSNDYRTDENHCHIDKEIKPVSHMQSNKENSQISILNDRYSVNVLDNIVSELGIDKHSLLKSLSLIKYQYQSGYQLREQQFHPKPIAREESFKPLVAGAKGYVARGEEVVLVLSGLPAPSAPSTIKPSFARSPRLKEQKSIKKAAFKKHIDLVSINTSNNKTTSDIISDSLSEEQILENALVMMNSEQVKSRSEKLGNVAILVENNRLLQLYFAKKFLQLGIVVDLFMTFYDASEALMESPNAYGMILMNITDLVSAENLDGLSAILSSLIPPNIDRMRYSIVVYGNLLQINDDLLDVLDFCGVEHLMEEPYSLDTLKAIWSSHQLKTQQIK